MEEGKKEDRRIVRTKTALQLALKELVNEKGYDTITVEDITTRANLGRTTFYLHYQDKEHLFLDSLEDHLSKIMLDFNKHPLIFWFQNQENNLIRSLFENIKSNAPVYKILTLDKTNRVYERFKLIITKAAWQMINENPWAQKKIKSISLPVDYVFEYFSGAMWSTIVWWSNHNFETPPREIASLFRQLFLPGLLKVLNVRKMNDLIETL